MQILAPSHLNLQLLEMNTAWSLQFADEVLNFDCEQIIINQFVFVCTTLFIFDMSLIVGYCILQINLVEGEEFTDSPTFLVFIG